MLDFSETTRRIMARHCQCGACNPAMVPHSVIAEPIVMQLHGDETLLLTPNERGMLAKIINRQAEMLDQHEDQALALTQLNEVNERLFAKIRKGVIGIGLFALTFGLMALGHAL